MIHLRPHHGLCIQQFEGKGYSEEFVENMTAIIKQLNHDPDQMITLCCRADDLCSHCPHRRKTGCVSGQKVELYDSTCLSLCDLKDGQSISWMEFQKRVKNKIISTGKLKTVCENCEWLSICEAHYKDQNSH